MADSANVPGKRRDDTEPVWDGKTGERVGHTHETDLGERLKEGKHEWHRENEDGSETVETYEVNDDNW